MTRSAMQLDERGLKQLAAATRKWLREAERIEEAAATRIDEATAADGDGPEAGREVGLVVMLFEAPARDDAGDGEDSRRHAAPRAGTAAGRASD